MKNKHLITSVIVALFSLFLIWTPFLLKLKTFWGIDFAGRTMSTIVANFDGINFLVVAKTLYDPKLIEVDYASILSGRQNLYFSAHYPLFPLVVKAFDVFLTGPNALLATIVLSNILLAVALYWFYKLIVAKDNVALYLTLIALFIPARMLSMRGVGSNESLFIFFVLTSLTLSVKGKHWLSAILGSLSVITRSPGILLFGAYMMPLVMDMWHKRKIEWKSYIPYLLIPLSLISLWFIYGLVFGDFLAYFKVGGNINLYLPPFMVFGSHFDWVSGMWREDIIYTFIFYAAGIALFFNNFVKGRKELNVIGYFGMIYLTMLFFIVHRDISRYALPIAPLAIAGFSPYLNSKYAKYGLAILLIPIFLYSFNFIIGNVQPVMDWSALL
jgi:Gpi18-like mannosyltransferase